MKCLLRLFVVTVVLASFANCSPNSASNSNPELMSTFEKDLDVYFGYMNDRDYANMLSMTNPRLFEVVPRETMVNMFKSLYESGLEMKVKDISPVSLSQIVKDGDDAYCQIKYEGQLTMTLSQTLMANIEMFKTELYKSYNREDVKIEVEKNQIIIDSEKEIIAMSADNQKTWTYFELQEGQDEMLSKLIPQSVLDKINQ